MKHTSNKRRFAVVIGRRVQLFIRPSLTAQKGYREPKSWLSVNCKNKAEAQKLAEAYELNGVLYYK